MSSALTMKAGLGGRAASSDTGPYPLKQDVLDNLIRLDGPCEVALLDRKMDFRSWLRSALEDPLVKAMMRRCLLTGPQLETLLIDLFADEILGRRLGIEEKASLRLGKKVSRGSFNRTLRQARLNVIKAIYTVLLLGYLGVLASPELEPYVELGSALRRLSEALGRGGVDGEAVSALKEEVISKLVELSRARALSKRGP